MPETRDAEPREYTPWPSEKECIERGHEKSARIASLESENARLLVRLSAIGVERDDLAVDLALRKVADIMMRQCPVTTAYPEDFAPDQRLNFVWDDDRYHFNVELWPDGKFEWFGKDRQTGDTSFAEGKLDASGAEPHDDGETDRLRGEVTSLRARLSEVEAERDRYRSEIAAAWLNEDYPDGMPMLMVDRKLWEEARAATSPEEPEP